MRFIESLRHQIIGVDIGSSREGIEGVNDGNLEDSESKTLVQNSGYLGQVGGEVLVDGNKALEESKVFVGEERPVDAKSETELGEDRRGMSFKMTDRFDETKNRVVEMMSRDDGWGSWGVMNLVGKVLSGKLCMDDEMEDVKKFGTANDINSIVSDEKKLGTLNIVNSIVGVADDVEDVKKFGNGKNINSIVADEVEDVNNFGTNHDENSDMDFKAWQNVIGEPVFEDGRGLINEIVISTDLDSQLDCSREGAGLRDVNKYGTGNDINSIVADELEDVKQLGTGYDISSIVPDDVEDVKQFGTGKDINSVVADEVTDVKNFRTGHDGNSDVDWNAWQNVIEELVFEDGRVVNETVVSTDLDKLDCSREGAGLSEKQQLVINEQMPDGGMENKGLNNVNSADVLMQSGCGEERVTKKEGEFNVSDLVWGKVRSHPWWPGQILPPSAASDKAIKHFKKNTYLIVYFGDQTFAWNEVSNIKPFRMHFSEMEKQSDAERFCRGVDFALGEVARRVELGLSCQCLPKEVHIRIKSQVIQNAGVKEESSIRDGRDCLSTATSFVPGDFLRCLKSLAEAPASETDRLQFGITKAQFLAFSRWKGCHQLWTFIGHGGLFENDAQFTMEEGGRNSRNEVNEDLSHSIDPIKVPFKKRKSTARDVSSRKYKHISKDELSKIEEECIPVLTASANLSLQDDKKTTVKSGMKTVSAGKKRGLFNSISNGKRQKKMSSHRPSDTCPSQPICSGGGSEVRFSARKSTIEEMIPGEFNPDEILLKLNSAAINPRQGYFILTPIIGLLRQIRNSAYLEKPHLQNLNYHSGKSKDKKSFSLETTDLHFEGTKDSNWTDRISQGYSQERVILGPKKLATKDASGAGLEVSIGMTAILDNQKQGDSVSQHCEAENLPAQVDEGSEEYFPTALLLNFTNLDSIPSVVNLNEIFRRYGPLDETQTKILIKSKRAKVVFTRRADAEAAFSSTGKYSIFGSSLLSYCLRYAASKARATSKGKRNTQP